MRRTALAAPQAQHPRAPSRRAHRVTDLQERRRQGFLNTAMEQLYARNAAVVSVGTEDDVAWLRDVLRVLARREGWKYRTGHHHYISTGVNGDEHFEGWWVWMIADPRGLALDAEVQAAVLRGYW